MSWSDELHADLERRRAEHLYRFRRVVDSAAGPEVQVAGRTLINLCSNDYLGLAGDPRLAEAMIAGVRRYGVGSGAAHLVTGHSRAHHELEEELAAFTGRARALLFSTGYMANLGVVSALLGRGGHCFEDRLNHASLIDAGLLSRATFRRYGHGDVAVLEGQLVAAGRGRRLVVTDGVFSMDGDVAPIPELAEACRRHEAWLMVDDAHGIGVLGANGGGTLEACGLGAAQVPVLMGTLGKALGTSGAFVAGDELLIETLIQHARTYVYTTATPPAVAEATRAALRIVQEEPWRRERLGSLIARFRREALSMGLPLMASPTPIQPIVAGSAARALEWSRALEAQGLLVGAIRPPTVPAGSARLRITFSAAHTDAHLDRLLEALNALSLVEGREHPGPAVA